MEEIELNGNQAKVWMGLSNLLNNPLLGGIYLNQAKSALNAKNKSHSAINLIGEEREIILKRRLLLSSPSIEQGKLSDICGAIE